VSSSSTTMTAVGGGVFTCASGFFVRSAGGQ
jgi:hypothetical protein